MTFDTAGKKLAQTESPEIGKPKISKPETCFPFTDRSLAAVPTPPRGKRVFVWDTKLTGLGCVISSASRTFIVNFRRDGDLVRENLGKVGEMSLPDARSKALVVLGRVKDDKATPGDKKKMIRASTTLEEALEEYLDAQRKAGGSQTNIDLVSAEQHRHLGDWMPRPLPSIAPRECRVRHAEISAKKEDGTGGKHVANRVLRQFSAIWNIQADEAVHEEVAWPVNPTRAVHYHKDGSEDFTTERRDCLSWAELPKWRLNIESKLTPLALDYCLLMLFTGLRRRDAATIREKHVNLTAEPVETQVWHKGKREFETKEIPPYSLLRPFPKGGSKRAFVVPLSQAAIEILARRIAANRRQFGDDCAWVFPGVSNRTSKCHYCAELGLPGQHIAGQITHCSGAALKDSGVTNPHCLRHTYSNAGQQSGVPERVVQLLMNHKWRKDNQTTKYQKPDLEFLRRCQERVSQFLLAKMADAVTKTQEDDSTFEGTELSWELQSAAS